MSRKRWRKLRYPFEYAGVRTGFALVDCLPPRLLTAMGRGLGSLGYAAMPARRRVAIDNLMSTGTVTSEREAACIARTSFRHFSLMALESLKAESLITPTNWRHYLKLDKESERVREEVIASNEGIILVSAHFGNWEIGGQVLSYDKPVVAVARQMNNPLTDRLINDRKKDQNFRFVPKTASGGGRLIEALREGSLLAILADQHARHHGVERDFLGRPAAVHTSPARLHLITGAPILVGMCHRTAPFQFQLNLAPLIRHKSTGNRAADVTAILDQIYAIIEAEIRNRPDQYLWAHRRWRVTDAA